jgi:hypothetical protein
MCWRLNFTLCEKQSVRFPKSEHSIFTVIRWSIFLNGGQLCVFHKLDIYACFSSYARISWTIWLNFTQETQKFLKRQEYKLKLKI